MNAAPQKRGFSLLELLLVMAVLGLLLALLFPVLAGARRSAWRTTCEANLRQIAVAEQAFILDHGRYPNPPELLDGPYLEDERVLFCPEDTSEVLLGARSSYAWRIFRPGTTTPIQQSTDLDPRAVVVSCRHHLGYETRVLKGDNTEQTPPRWPFYLVLRADGSIDRVHVDQVREVRVSGDRPMWHRVFPGEPDYPAEDVS